MIRTIAAAAIAATLLAASAGAATAATWAWADNDANVRNNHYPNAPIVNWIEEGQKVRVIGQWKNWYKLQIPGKDGWVRANVLDFDDYDDGPGYPVGPGFGTQFCIDGKKADFCIGTQF